MHTHPTKRILSLVAVVSTMAFAACTCGELEITRLDCTPGQIFVDQAGRNMVPLTCNVIVAQGGTTTTESTSDTIPDSQP
jgi:hypothetical protein